MKLQFPEADYGGLISHHRGQRSPSVAELTSRSLLRVSPFFFIRASPDFQVFSHKQVIYSLKLTEKVLMLEQRNLMSAACFNESAKNPRKL